jgi:xanthine dehydrogenase accessory factor
MTGGITMKDVLDSLNTWTERDEDIAVATVINTWGSAPRPVGSKLITTRSGGIAGSVSAGCVEGAVIEAGKDVMGSGVPRLLHYGVADDTAWEVGLACGGEIDVFVEPFSALEGIYGSVKAHLEAGDPMAVVSVLDGPPDVQNRKLIVLEGGATEGTLELGAHEEAVVADALRHLADEKGGLIEPEEGLTLFIEVYPPDPRLIIVGAVHIAEPLVAMANAAGYETILVDPRSAFATRERFPHVHSLIGEWPDSALSDMTLNHSAYVVVLTHDPKLDDPALIEALQSDARYVGALGSKRTNRLRIERLREAGLTDEQIGRLHAPIGLYLGGRTPPEIAVSILAEIIKVRNEPVDS